MKENEVFKCTIRLHSNSKELAPSRDCWVFTVAASGRTRVKSENWEPRPLAIADPFHKHGSQACTSKATPDQTVAFNSKCERRTGAQHPNANGVMFLLNPITLMYKTPPNLAYTILYLHILRWCGPRWAWTHCTTPWWRWLLRSPIAETAVFKPRGTSQNPVPPCLGAPGATRWVPPHHQCHQQYLPIKSGNRKCQVLVGSVGKISK